MSISFGGQENLSSDTERDEDPPQYVLSESVNKFFKNQAHEIGQVFSVLSEQFLVIDYLYVTGTGPAPFECAGLVVLPVSTSSGVVQRTDDTVRYVDNPESSHAVGEKTLVIPPPCGGGEYETYSKTVEHKRADTAGEEFLEESNRLDFVVLGIDQKGDRYELSFAASRDGRRYIIGKIE